MCHVDDDLHSSSLTVSHRFSQVSHFIYFILISLIFFSFIEGENVISFLVDLLLFLTILKAF